MAGQRWFGPVAPDDPDAASMLRGYVEELRARFAPRPFEGAEAWDLRVFAPPGGAVVLARVEGHPVGCAGLRPLAPGVGELKHLFVVAAQRGRGVARGLLTEVERLAVAVGHRTLVLDTAAPLVEAVALYRASGYAPVERYNENPYAVAWFSKSLPTR